MTDAAPLTAWSRGRLDARDRPSQVLFGRMYEDAKIELEAFGPGRVFCIASAGCTAIALSRTHEVVAVDINAVQLAYARSRCRGEPSHPGRAETFMNAARFFAPAVGWTRSRLSEFVGLQDVEEQLAFWESALDTWRFRRALDVLFLPVALRRVYASPLLESLPARFGAALRSRMERCFSRHPNRENPHARALLLGELCTEPAPPEASHITLVQAEAAQFLEAQPAGSFDGFALSNILDGTTGAFRDRLAQAVRRAAAPNARVVLRSFGEHDAGLPEDRAADDRSMLWGSVLVMPADQLAPHFQRRERSTSAR